MARPFLSEDIKRLIEEHNKIREDISYAAEALNAYQEDIKVSAEDIVFSKSVLWFQEYFC